jgi:hypothetical protein
VTSDQLDDHERPAAVEGESPFVGAAECWSLVSGHWSLATGFWSLVSDNWSLKHRF